MTLYFEQTKPNKEGVKQRYKILSFDKEKNTITIQGPSGVGGFEEKFDKAHFQRMGYTLVNVAEDEE